MFIIVLGAVRCGGDARAVCAARYSVQWPLVRTPIGHAQLQPFVRLVNDLNHRCQMVQGQTKDPKNPSNTGRHNDPAQHFRSLVEVCALYSPPPPLAVSATCAMAWFSRTLCGARLLPVSLHVAVWNVMMSHGRRA